MSLLSRKPVEQDPIHVRVWDDKQEEVLFDGKVSTSSVEPRHLSKLPSIDAVFGSWALCIKGSKEELESFEGLGDHVELVPVKGVWKRSDASFVVYVDEDGIVKTSPTVPTCNASIMTVSKLSQEQCVKAFQCVSLEELLMDAPLLNEIPKDIGKMTKLRKLRISSRFLVRIAEEFTMLKSLKELLIYSDRLKHIPLAGLDNLEVLELFCLDELETLSEDIGQLRSLKQLSIFSCRIFRSIPTHIGALKQLEDLNLDNLPSMKSIPDEIEHLPKLESLTVTDCEVLSVPKLPTRLRDLCLSYLPKVTLDTSQIMSFSRFKHLSVTNCAKVFTTLDAWKHCVRCSTTLFIFDICIVTI